MRDHLQAEACPKREEVCVLSIRELLGDGRHRHSGRACPGSCQVPVAAVRQRDDNSGSCVGSSDHRLVDGGDAPLDLGLGPSGQRQHLVEVAQVGLQRGPNKLRMDGRSRRQRQIAPQVADVDSIFPQRDPTGGGDDQGNRSRREPGSHLPAEAVDPSQQPAVQQFAPLARHGWAPPQPTEHSCLGLFADLGDPLQTVICLSLRGPLRHLQHVRYPSPAGRPGEDDHEPSARAATTSTGESEAFGSSLTYDVHCPKTRPAKARQPTLSILPVHEVEQDASETAASPSLLRWSQESAPVAVLPVILAIKPSISRRDEDRYHEYPCHSHPWGKRSARRSPPRVPAIVTTSGETPT